MSDLYQLIFLSKSNPELGEEEVYQLIDDIHQESSCNNVRDDISGAMLWVDGYFCQVLEGPDEQLQRRFGVIQADPRHSACKLLRYEPIEQRQFPAEPLRVVGVSWAPIRGLSAALDGLGVISSTDAGEQIITALLGAERAIPVAEAEAIPT